MVSVPSFNGWSRCSKLSGYDGMVRYLPVFIVVTVIYRYQWNLLESYVKTSDISDIGLI